MVNKFRRGFTAEEAALIATGLDRFDSLDSANKLFQEAKQLNISTDKLNNIYEDGKKIAEATSIQGALLEEVYIACQWHDYLSGELKLYNSNFTAQPNDETPLEVFEIMRRLPRPDDPRTHQPLPKITTITKISLAKWFEANLPDKAKLFDPSESYKTAKTGYIKELLAKQVTPIQQAPPTAQIEFSKQITETDTWKELHDLALKAVSEFPDWKTQNEKPRSNSSQKQKITMEVIDDWLKELQKSTKRENDTIKKILIEIFNL